jgi:hypothetical protein
MLTALHLGNFKAFRETQRVPIRPLTLVYGENSAGKSTILHALLFAREAMETGNLDVYKPSLAADSVDLGGFQQFVHRHDLDKAVTWEADLAATNSTEIREARIALQISHSSWGPAVNEMAVSALGASFLRLTLRSPVVANHAAPFFSRGIRQRDRANHFWGTGVRLLIHDLDFGHPLIQVRLLPAVETVLGRELDGRGRAKVRRFVDELSTEITAFIDRLVPAGAELAYPEDYFPKGFKDACPQLIRWLDTRDWRTVPKCLSGRRSAKSHLEGIVAVILFALIDDLLQWIYRDLATTLDRFTYLGPLRSYPERHYTFASEPGDYYSRGHHAWNVLCANESVREKVDSWMDRLGIGYRSCPRVWRAGKAGQTPGVKRELALLDKRTGAAVSHRDIGVGISQILPIMATACGSENQLHAIEQPEIHIHPALQAKLADLFIDSALGEQKNTFLLETHSEHLLLRIMRRMRETSAGRLPREAVAVTPNDVAVLYVQPDGPRSIVREMPLNERGELIKAWPGGFFEEGLREVFA